MKIRNRSIIYFVLIVLNMFGCNDFSMDNDNSGITNYRTDYPVSDDLNVPKLTIGVGIESGHYSIKWTSVDIVSHYELEESFDLNFSSAFLAYTGTENSFTRSQPRMNKYYRVRVIYNSIASRWSNVVFR